VLSLQEDKMDMKDFVAEALQQIVERIKTAQDSIQQHGTAIIGTNDKERSE